MTTKSIVARGRCNLSSFKKSISNIELLISLGKIIKTFRQPGILIRSITEVYAMYSIEKRT